MPYDPLYLETPGVTALLEELGVPAGVVVHIYRPGREWWAAKDLRLEKYQVMFLVTVGPDGEREGPRTWTPGAEPYHVWLARIRYGDDIAYGEVRPSVAEGLYCQVRWPAVLEGQVPLIETSEVERANYGVLLLRDLVSKLGRIPDAVLAPDLAAERKAKILSGILGRLRLGYHTREVTQPIVASDIHVPLRTLRHWLRRYYLRWAVLKQEAGQLYRSSHQ